jgi:hypothetical protein
MSSALIAEPSTAVPPRPGRSRPVKATQTQRSALERHAVLIYFGLTLAISASSV